MQSRVQQAVLAVCLLSFAATFCGDRQSLVVAQAPPAARQVPPYRAESDTTQATTAQATSTTEQPPSGILGPDTVAPGSLGHFQVVDAPAGSVCYWVGPDDTGEGVTDRGGIHHFYLARMTPGPCSIVAIVAWVDAGEPVQTKLVHRLTIGVDPDDGGDNPPPKPPTPTTTLDARVLALASKLPAQAKPAAKLLAQSFRRAVSDSKAGLAPPSALNTAISSRNTEIAGENATLWRDTVWVPLGADLKALYDAGKLQTPEHYQEAWSLIAAGLDKVSP